MTVAVPCDAAVLIQITDDAGQHSLVRINFGTTPDIDTDANAFWATTSLNNIFRTIFDPNASTDVARLYAALTNAKITRVGLVVDADWAAEPSSETGSYKLVQSRAATHWQSGAGEKEGMAIPAPKDSLFLTTVGMQQTVDPALASSGQPLRLLQAQIALLGAKTANGGTWGSLFMGGQLVNGKPPRRRRIQSQ